MIEDLTLTLMNKYNSGTKVGVIHVDIFIFEATSTTYRRTAGGAGLVFSVLKWLWGLRLLVFIWLWSKGCKDTTHVTVKEQFQCIVIYTTIIQIYTM
jgi:hypothetical protein